MRRFIIAGTGVHARVADSIYGGMADAIEAEVLTLPWLGLGHTRGSADYIAERLPQDELFDIVGHSQGGLVAFDIAGRPGFNVRRCVTLGAPLAGTALSPLWAPFPAARCMARRARYTDDLHARFEWVQAFVGLHCVAGSKDRLVFPTHTAHCSGWYTNNYTLEGLGHTDLATSGEAISLVHDILTPLDGTMTGVLRQHALGEANVRLAARLALL